MPSFVVLSGSLSDGYIACGPYPDFDTAAMCHPDMGVIGVDNAGPNWIMTLEPTKYTRKGNRYIIVHWGSDSALVDTIAYDFSTGDPDILVMVNDNNDFNNFQNYKEIDVDTELLMKTVKNDSPEWEDVLLYLSKRNWDIDAQETSY